MSIAQNTKVFNLVRYLKLFSKQRLCGLFGFTLLLGCGKTVEEDAQGRTSISFDCNLQDASILQAVKPLQYGTFEFFEGNFKGRDRSTFKKSLASRRISTSCGFANDGESYDPAWTMSSEEYDRNSNELGTSCVLTSASGSIRFKGLNEARTATTFTWALGENTGTMEIPCVKEEFLSMDDPKH